MKSSIGSLPNIPLIIDLTSLLLYIVTKPEYVTTKYYCYLCSCLITRFYIENQLKLLQSLWDRYSYFTSLATILLCILSHINSIMVSILYRLITFMLNLSILGRKGVRFERLGVACVIHQLVIIDNFEHIDETHIQLKMKEDHLLFLPLKVRSEVSIKLSLST